MNFYALVTSNNDGLVIDSEVWCGPLVYTLKKDANFARAIAVEKTRKVNIVDCETGEILKVSK